MTNLSNLKKIKSFDISEFDGVKSKIEEIQLLDVEKKNFGDGEKEVRQLRIFSSPLNDSGEPIRASEFISLKKDVDSNEWGIPDNSESKAMKVLNYFKVADFEKLQGVECMIVKRVKGEKSFLGIHYG